MCARRRSNFFHAEKSHQKRPTLLSATPSLRCGATCVGALAGCAVELTSLLCSCVRTTTASQSTKHARTCAHATPQAPPHRRIHKGLGSPHRPSLRSALERAYSHTIGHLVSPQAESSDGPCGCLAFCCTKPLWPCREAQRRADQGSRLFERAARVQRDPARREHRRLPRAQHGVTDSRVAFLLASFLWRRKEKMLARRGETRLLHCPTRREPIKAALSLLSVGFSEATTWSGE